MKERLWLLTYGLGQIGDGLVTVLSIGYIRTSFALRIAEGLSRWRNKRY